MEIHREQADKNPQQHVTIHSIFEHYAKEMPDHAAVIAGEQAFTYGQLNHRANQLAHHLRALTAERETLIAIALDRSFDMLVSLFAILKAGCAYVPLDDTQPQERLAYILEDTKTPVLITKASLKEKFATFAGHVVLTDEHQEQLGAVPSHNLDLPAKPEQLAYVIYTSGTTGKPKGVLIEHKNAVNYIQWLAHYTGCKQRDRVDFSSNVIFDMAVTTSITPLALGMQVVICSDDIKHNVHQYLSFLVEQKISLIKMTPSYFRLMTHEAKLQSVKLPDLKHIILGGESLRAAECKDWLSLYPQHHLFNEYGPTETTIAVTQYKITHPEVLALNEQVPIGKPGKRMSCRILKNDKTAASLGEIGELYIGGDGVARGYLNQDLLTKQQFIANPYQNDPHNRLYKTGDLCQYSPEGDIEFLGRIDDQVKIRGYRIEPSEIEAHLTKHPLINNAAVIAFNNAAGEKQLAAYYILSDPATAPKPPEIRQYLQQRLADYMEPAFLIPLEAFPLTKNGKLDKQALPLPQIDQPSSSTPPTPPGTALEKQLATMWAEAFYRHQILITDNFFELGGHSLTAARIVTSIEKNLGKTISIQDLYFAPTIQQLAAVIEQAAMGDTTEVNPAISIDQYTLPLSDFQFLFWISSLFEPKVKKLNIIAKRRFNGKLDITALSFAFNEVIKKHQILSHWISPYIPTQHIHKNHELAITEIDIQSLSDKEKEFVLMTSLQTLQNHYPWQKGSPLLIAKLFYLDEGASELQICLPHIIFDDASEEIIFNDLSRYYLAHQQHLALPDYKDGYQYANYVFAEKKYYKKYLNRDVTYWQQYLNDTKQFTFPLDQIVTATPRFTYSTYLALPKSWLHQVHRLCAEYQISITDLLCAATALTLHHHCIDEGSPYHIMNVIRSNRSDFTFDQTIGCFLRLDPVKISIQFQSDLISMAKQIQKSNIQTEPYQSCSSMMKLACLDKSYRKKPLRRTMMSAISSFISKLSPSFKLHPKLIAMYLRLNSIRKKQDFMVNLNLLNNFIATTHDETLFGLPLKHSTPFQPDLSTIDNVLDICFLRDTHQNQLFLVISGNLTPAFRELIGNEIMQHITTHTHTSSRGAHDPNHTSHIP